MTFVITGATGHIGNNLVRLLLQKGYPVRIITRQIEESIEGLDCEVVFGNFYDDDVMEKAIHEGDVVMHLAARIDLKNKKHGETYFINYDSAVKIASFCYQRQVKRFIYVSSVDAINRLKNGPIVEKEYLDYEKLVDDYPKSKAMATNAIQDFKKMHPDFHLSIVYPAACIGINDYKPSAIGKVIRDSIKGKMEFGIKGHYNFVDVEDVAFGIVRIAELGKEGSYILSGETHTIMELYDAVNAYLGRKRFKVEIPTFIARLAIPFYPYLSNQTLRIIQDNSDYRCDKAKEELGYNPKPFNEVVKKTAEWFSKRK